MLIVGAGIIGLACALELRSAGYRVTVLERGRAMEQASWAAAGMLAAEDPANAPALAPLSRWSLKLYPEFLARVEALSGHRVPLRTQVTYQGEHEPQRPAQPCAEVPELRTRDWCFSRLEEASLDPRDLCAALPVAARAAGVELREHTEVVRLDGHGAASAPGVSAELSDGARIEADACVVAGGAWTGMMRLGDLPRLPVVPRKGQMIAVTLDQPELKVVLRTPEIYLVPRGDGRVIIGATVEDHGFDRSVDDQAGERLWRSAGALWPPILSGSITASWTGLRPGLLAEHDDGLPLIGSISDGLWLATGHFRNGILLAPGTARLMRQLMRGNSTELDAAPYTPERVLTLLASNG